MIQQLALPGLHLSTLGKMLALLAQAALALRLLLLPPPTQTILSASVAVVVVVVEEDDSYDGRFTACAKPRCIFKE